MSKQMQQPASSNEETDNGLLATAKETWDSFWGSNSEQQEELEASQIESDEQSGGILDAFGDWLYGEDENESASTQVAEARIVDGEGGYQYKQYPDGTIEILAGDTRIVGEVYPPEHNTNKAITEEIGPYPSQGSGSDKAKKQGAQSKAETTGSDEATFANENWAKATSFEQLITMVETAEVRLIQSGLASSTADVVHLIRGIFYGTEWSMDYAGEGNEGSEMRNKGFDYYTKSTRPDDPRPALGESLFEALRSSPEVKDPSGRHTDFGHLIIGLECQTWAGKNLPTGTGGTGLEVVTWLGDVGGGAGQLAVKRASNPSKKAIDHFPLTGSDYGASINLEGDIAGTVGVVIEDGQSLADALRDYLMPDTGGDGEDRYNRRAQLFLESIGGDVSDGELTNEEAISRQIGQQFSDFGTFYAISRLHDQEKLSAAGVREGGRHINGAAYEMAVIFVRAIAAGLQDPAANISADSSMDPGVTAPSADVHSAWELAAKGIELKESASNW